jgi:hypothetical protein
MTPEEDRALKALNDVSMRLGSSGKRFRRDINWQIEYAEEKRLTKGQAMYLWFLCDMYRRQIKDEQVLRWAEHRRLLDELPPIYLEGDHRERVPCKKKEAKPHVEKHTPACAEGYANESQISLWEER